MKRNFVIATLVALMLVTGLVVTASAQTPQPTPTTPVTAGACANGSWVDANNDGVCDNAPRDGSGMQFGQQNGQGMNRANGQAQGMQGRAMQGRGMQGRGMQNGQSWNN